MVVYSSRHGRVRLTAVRGRSRPGPDPQRAGRRQRPPDDGHAERRRLPRAAGPVRHGVGGVRPPHGGVRHQLLRGEDHGRSPPVQDVLRHPLPAGRADRRLRRVLRPPHAGPPRRPLRGLRRGDGGDRRQGARADGPRDLRRPGADHLADDRRGRHRPLGHDRRHRRRHLLPRRRRRVRGPRRDPAGLPRHPRRAGGGPGLSHLGRVRPRYRDPPVRLPGGVAAVRLLDRPRHVPGAVLRCRPDRRERLGIPRPDRREVRRRPPHPVRRRRRAAPAADPRRPAPEPARQVPVPHVHPGVHVRRPRGDGGMAVVAAE